MDVYYLACQRAWRSDDVDPDDTASIIEPKNYNAAVESLLRTAPRFGRLSAEGLIILQSEGTVVVPIVHRGFAWEATDFQRLHAPPTGRERFLTRRYAGAGIGCPVVVERRRSDHNSIEQRFFPDRSFFAATALVRFDTNQTAHKSPILEFRNPVVSRAFDSRGQHWPLAYDLSAPLAKMLEDAPRVYLAGFVDPGADTASARLQMLEPYQPGKIPLVLIHGLYADPLSWSDLVNDLQAVPGFAAKYQIWLYRYPTGQGFLQSAAGLRRELRAAIHQCDPDRLDSALHHTVLAGHSMGGLIAKLQVTHSRDFVWNRLASRPLTEIATTDTTRALLADTCYFEPSPDVDRVIFIASPHCGSLCWSALVGCGASHFVRPKAEQVAIHEQLIRDNPGVFNPLFERRFPTSVDMLAPQSPLLAAMRQMQVKPSVKLHNIVGVSHPISLEGPSDGIVSARSASHPDCESLLNVNESHARVHRTEEASVEILRILDEHATACR